MTLSSKVFSYVEYTGYLIGPEAKGWVEKCNAPSAWNSLAAESPNMTMCDDPVPLLKSAPYDQYYPAEFLRSGVSGSLGIDIQGVQFLSLNGGGDSLYSTVSTSVDIAIDTIIQVPLNGGSESLASTISSDLTIISLVITQEAISAGQESIVSPVFGSLGITIT